MFLFSLLFQHEKEKNEAMENEIEGARIDFVVSDTCVCVCVCVCPRDEAYYFFDSNTNVHTCKAKQT